jgi:hypothetical protein
MWDLFISHAGEDKDVIARPLATKLQEHGFKVWYDEFTLSLGDHLRQSIERGLAESDFAVVILSPDFFGKKWTNLELDGIIALEKPGEKRILPVWHNVTSNDVVGYSSFLANRVGASTSRGLDYVIGEIRRAIEGERQRGSASQTRKLSIHPQTLAMLLAAQEGDGRLIVAEHLGGLSISSGNESFGDEGNPRSEALVLHCLDELVGRGLVVQEGKSLYGLTDEGYDSQVTEALPEVSRPTFPPISSSNQSIAHAIMRAAASADGQILYMSLLSGRHLQAGGFAEESMGDRKKEVRWASTIKELESHRLIRPVGNKGEIYYLTHLGYLWTDELNVRESDATRGSDRIGSG